MANPRNRKYPWAKWLNNRKAFTIVKGKDFKVTTLCMAQQLRNRISKEGLCCSILEQTKTKIKVRINDR